MWKRFLLAMTVMVLGLMSGCTMRPVDQMYCLPKRPAAYNNLQAVMDEAMAGKEYCAPLTGENLQTVQMVDLDGDGEREYLLFAKSESQKVLQILVFRHEDGKYALSDTVECNGSAFDQVEYAQMDGRGGMELVIGCKLSDQLPRSVCVYTCVDAEIKQVATANYTKFLTCDLNDDMLTELMVFRSGQSNGDKGIAELYSMASGSMVRFNDVSMSGSADSLKHIAVGMLGSGAQAVFADCAVEGQGIVTDVYTVVDGVFTNLPFSAETATSHRTLREKVIYVEDVDGDGEIELPALMDMKLPDTGELTGDCALIRWYTLDKGGSETDKLYTYHDFAGGWYMELGDEWADRICVVQDGDTYGFYLWNRMLSQPQRIFTVYAFSGQNREELALMENRFILQREKNTVYAAHLEVASGNMNLSREALIQGFHKIRQEWKTGIL